MSYSKKMASNESTNSPASAAAAVAIRVTSLSKCYRAYQRPRDRLKQIFSNGAKQYFTEIWALKEMSFEIKRGETIGIIGRNGSGKSTLLQLLCGTLQPTAGTIEVNGKVAALLELGAGFNPDFTGRENVFLNGALYGLTQKQIAQRFDKIAAFADIGAFIDQPVRTYSSGMFVRLAFAVIAHLDADILIIDEALAVGDVYFVQKCMRFLREFAKNGTLLFVSHDTPTVVGLCSRALLLSNGELTRSGTPKEVAEVYLKTLLQKSQTPTDPFNANSSDSDPAHNDFKSSKAEILSAEVLGASGHKILTLSGGERVVFKIVARANVDVPNPILGIVLKDRLGQNLFGKNTYTAENPAPEVRAGTTVEATFELRFPKLAAGHYSFGVAFASGTQSDHEQLHWIHDATTIQVIETGFISGIFEPTFDKIQLRPL